MRIDVAPKSQHSSADRVVQHINIKTTINALFKMMYNNNAHISNQLKYIITYT